MGILAGVGFGLWKTAPSPPAPSPQHAEVAQAFKAADQGFAAAQANLGRLYEQGRGVPQSDTEAARLYKLAADQGLAAAQANLGILGKNQKK
jgi:TPR repeat protein